MWHEERHNGLTVYGWNNEVTATTPAKHGDGDYEVKFHAPWADCTRTPTQQAMVFALAFMAMGEENCWSGRTLRELSIAGWADRAVNVRTVDMARRLAEWNLLTWEQHRAVGRF